MTLNPQSQTVRSFEFDSLLWWKRSGIWMILILGAAVFLMLRSPEARTRRKTHSQVEAVNNAAHIGFALTEFQKKYGKRPDSTTIAAVKQNTVSDLYLGAKSSNDFFRQLLATKIVNSEALFYAEINGVEKPDDHFAKTEALKKGECGFTYFIGALETDNPLRPIAITPMIPGTDRFDIKPFGGRAVILRANNSVTVVPIILNTGHIKIDGLDLMDPSNPIWDGHAPVIAWPE